MHAEEPSLIGRWTIIYHLACAHNDLQVSATGQPLDGVAYQYAISQPPSEANHPLGLCGLPWSPWKKTSGVIRHSILFSHNGPPPPHYSWRWITPSLGPTPRGSILWTPLNHCNALADHPFTALDKSSETAVSFTFNTLVIK
jgi:hypothetical protein